MPLGMMAPPMTEFTEDDLIPIPGWENISLDDALSGSYIDDFDIDVLKERLFDSTPLNDIELVRIKNLSNNRLNELLDDFYDYTKIEGYPETVNDIRDRYRWIGEQNRQHINNLYDKIDDYEDWIYSLDNQEKQDLKDWIIGLRQRGEVERNWLSGDRSLAFREMTVYLEKGERGLRTFNMEHVGYSEGTLREIMRVADSVDDIVPRTEIADPMILTRYQDSIKNPDLKKGDIFEWKSIRSTTLDPNLNIWEDNRPKISILGSEGTKGAYIDTAPFFDMFDPEFDRLHAVPGQQAEFLLAGKQKLQYLRKINSNHYLVKTIK